MNQPQKAFSGPGGDALLGLGLRQPHFRHVLDSRPAVGWFEAISENFMGLESGRGGPSVQVLEAVRERYPISLHGVSLNLGSADLLDQAYLRRLEGLIARIDPVRVSDHACWTGIDGENLHDLLPLPYTELTVRHFAAKVREAQAVLGRQILIENLSSYVEFETSEMTEWEFLSSIAELADCGILLDVNNIYVSAINHAFDPISYLKGVPTARIGEIHLAGFSNRGRFLLDTHSEAVHDPVWVLYGEAIKLLGPVPTMIEWDDNIPEFRVLEGELDRARSILASICSSHGFEASSTCALAS